MSKKLAAIAQVTPMDNQTKIENMLPKSSQEQTLNGDMETLTSFHFDVSLTDQKVTKDFENQLTKRLIWFWLSRSCYFPIAVPQVRYVRKSNELYTVSYALSIHCRVQDVRCGLAAFINWIMPYIENGGDKKKPLCFGYTQEYEKVPQFIMWKEVE